MVHLIHRYFQAAGNLHVCVTKRYVSGQAGHAACFVEKHLALHSACSSKLLPRAIIGVPCGVLLPPLLENCTVEDLQPEEQRRARVDPILWDLYRCQRFLIAVRTCNRQKHQCSEDKSHQLRHIGCL